MKTRTPAIALIFVGFIWLLGYSLMREAIIGEMARHFRQVLPAKECFTRNEVIEQIDNLQQHICNHLPSVKLPTFILLSGMGLYMWSTNRESKMIKQGKGGHP